MENHWHLLLHPDENGICKGVHENEMYRMHFILKNFFFFLIIFFFNFTYN